MGRYWRETGQYRDERWREAGRIFEGDSCWHMKGCRLLVRLVSDERWGEVNPVWMHFLRTDVGLKMEFLGDSFRHYTGLRHGTILEHLDKATDSTLSPGILHHLPVNVLYCYLHQAPHVVPQMRDAEVREEFRRRYVESLRPMSIEEDISSDYELFSSDED